VAASSAADAIASAVDQLEGTADTQESFLRTFPSTSIPAYGLRRTEIVRSAQGRLVQC
jgi:hypothetical protein